MAAIPTDIEIEPAPERSRLNEIIVIALVAAALLLGLCLASYHPNDPSWNAAGEASARNWIGTVVPTREPFRTGRRLARRCLPFG
jgi:hypothetical protein